MTEQQLDCFLQVEDCLHDAANLVDQFAKDCPTADVVEDCARLEKRINNVLALMKEAWKG